MLSQQLQRWQEGIDQAWVEQQNSVLKLQDGYSTAYFTTMYRLFTSAVAAEFEPSLLCPSDAYYDIFVANGSGAWLPVAF